MLSIRERVQETLDIWNQIDRNLKELRVIEIVSDEDEYQTKFCIVRKNLILLTTAISIEGRLTEDQFKITMDEIYKSLETILMQLGTKKLEELVKI